MGGRRGQRGLRQVAPLREERCAHPKGQGACAATTTSSCRSPLLRPPCVPLAGRPRTTQALQHHRVHDVRRGQTSAWATALRATPCAARRTMTKRAARARTGYYPRE
eukprot:scaffold191444_cov41-Tisochrysis_lutea.AAC.2